MPILRQGKPITGKLGNGPGIFIGRYEADVRDGDHQTGKGGPLQTLQYGALGSTRTGTIWGLKGTRVRAIFHGWEADRFLA